MYKTINLILLLVIFVFYLCTYNFYLSNKNFKTKEFNRINIDQIINEKISNLPILVNDTENVIEFNNSLTNETNNNKPRSFWNLLKSK